MRARGYTYLTSATAVEYTLCDASEVEDVVHFEKGLKHHFVRIDGEVVLVECEAPCDICAHESKQVTGTIRVVGVSRPTGSITVGGFR